MKVIFNKSSAVGCSELPDVKGTTADLKRSAATLRAEVAKESRALSRASSGDTKWRDVFDTLASMDDILKQRRILKNWLIALNIVQAVVICYFIAHT